MPRTYFTNSLLISSALTIIGMLHRRQSQAMSSNYSTLISCDAIETNQLLSWLLSLSYSGSVGLNARKLNSIIQLSVDEVATTILGDWMNWLAVALAAGMKVMPITTSTMTMQIAKQFIIAAAYWVYSCWQWRPSQQWMRFRLRSTIVPLF